MSVVNGKVWRQTASHKIRTKENREKNSFTTAKNIAKNIQQRLTPPLSNIPSEKSDFFKAIFKILIRPKYMKLDL